MFLIYIFNKSIKQIFYFAKNLCFFFEIQYLFLFQYKGIVARL